jgi:hypothetical protein
MLDTFVMPKGRMTIRKGPSNGALNKNINLWELEPKPGTTLAKLEAAYLAALDGVEQVEKRKVEAKTSGRFTDEGVAADVLTFATSKVAPTFHRHGQAIAAAKKEAAELRGKLKLRPVDKTDLVGAMRRAEIRSWLRAMPADERNRYISKTLATMDGETALAIREMPPEMTGVLGSHREQLIDLALQAQHGEAITELQDLERGIEVADRALTAAREEIAHESGVHDLRKFDDLAKPHIGEAVWLRKYRKDDQEIVGVLKWDADNRSGSVQPATPEEIELGQYFANYDEYRQAGGTGGGGGLSGAA